MSFESFHNHPPSPEIEPRTVESTIKSRDGSSSGAERERFGWNDVIVPEDNLRIAEKIIRECGLECTSKVIPENRQYYDSDPQKKSWDEFVISVTYPERGEPVDRETLKTVIAALRNGETHVVVRVARLAPGEHFG